MLCDIYIFRKAFRIILFAGLPADIEFLSDEDSGEHGAGNAVIHAYNCCSTCMYVVISLLADAATFANYFRKHKLLQP